MTTVDVDVDGITVRSCNHVIMAWYLSIGPAVVVLSHDKPTPVAFTDICCYFVGLCLFLLPAVELQCGDEGPGQQLAALVCAQAGSGLCQVGK